MREHSYKDCQLCFQTHKGRRGQMKTIIMEHLNSILFHKSELANKQHNYQSETQENESYGSEA